MINSDYVGIHDADLEYYPEDLVQMYKYINNNQLVLGSRFISEDKRSNIYKRTLFANFSYQNYLVLSIEQKSRILLLAIK